MPLVPTKIQDAIQFCELHIQPITANAAAIGLTTPQATGFKDDTLAARAAYNAYQTAVEAARVAQIAQADAVAQMRRRAGDTFRLVRAYAETQANPNAVYNLAQIPPPATPTPKPPPGQPGDFRVGLNPDGSLTIKWKCPNPPGSQGTVYHVARRVGGEGPFTTLGTIGVRQYTDETVPASAAGVGVQYLVQAQRADAVGEPSFPFTVLFGAGGAGLTITAAFSGEPPMKKAA